MDQRRRAAEAGLVVGIGGLLGFAGGRGERGEVVVGVPSGQPGGHVRLDQCPGGIEVCRGGAAQLQDHGERLGQAIKIGHRDDRPAAAAPFDRDQTLGFQDPQRLAQGGAGDAQLLGELLLRWQTVADSEFAAGNASPDAGGHRLARLDPARLDSLGRTPVHRRLRSGIGPRYAPRELHEKNPPPIFLARRSRRRMESLDEFRSRVRSWLAERFEPRDPNRDDDRVDIISPRPRRSPGVDRRGDFDAATTRCGWIHWAAASGGVRGRRPDR